MPSRPWRRGLSLGAQRGDVGRLLERGKGSLRVAACFDGGVACAAQVAQTRPPRRSSSSAQVAGVACGQERHAPRRRARPLCCPAGQRRRRTPARARLAHVSVRCATPSCSTRSASVRRPALCRGAATARARSSQSAISCWVSVPLARATLASSRWATAHFLDAGEEVDDALRRECRRHACVALPGGPLPVEARPPPPATARAPWSRSARLRSVSWRRASTPASSPWTRCRSARATRRSVCSHGDRRPRPRHPGATPQRRTASRPLCCRRPAAPHRLRRRRWRRRPGPSVRRRPARAVAWSSAPVAAQAGVRAHAGARCVRLRPSVSCR